MHALPAEGLAEEERCTIARTSGFRPTSQSSMPASRSRFSPSISIFSAVYSRSKMALQVERHDLRLFLRGDRSDLAAEPLGVGEEHAALRAHDEQARERLVLGMLRRCAAGRRWCRACARARAPADSPPGRRAPSSDRMIAMRMPLQGAEQHDAGERGERPDELGAADPEDRAELRRLDQADRVDDDEAGQRRPAASRR